MKQCTMESMAQSSDSDDLDRKDMMQLAGGNDTGLNRLMERHGDRILHYLMRILQHEQDALDLAQETFVRVFTHRSRFRSGGKFSTWLFSIATNLARDQMRWRARHPNISFPNADESECPENAGRELGPFERVRNVEEAELVREAVQELPEALRIPLVLAEYERKTQKEIATVTNCSPKAVEMRIYRARKELREKLVKVIKL